MQPNILYIICHDLGRHLACCGDGTIPSPKLDALAAEGVLFTNLYAASTPCSPARGCLMTGRYAHCQGLIGLAHKGWDYDEGTRTVAHDLSGAGYLTYLVGLQHESPRVETLGYRRTWLDSHRSDRVADEVMRFLSTDAAANQPFFLSAGLGEVHLPFDRDYYDFAEPARVALPGFLPDNEHTRRQMAMFHGAIRFMDRHLGRMLAALDDSPLKDNTIVLFTTDHGMAFPRAKSTLYDPGIGVAMIVRVPEPADGPGRLCQDLVSGVDLRPTLCELAGAPVPDEVQGRSFAPLLTGRGAYQPRTEIFSEKNYHNHFDPVRCVRTDRYKYIRNLRDAPYCLLPSDIQEAFPPRSRRPDLMAPRPEEELYDLSADPGEDNNLIGSPEHAAARDELRGKLQAWLEQTHDPILKDRFIPYPPKQFAR
jgi:arylsulfatase A-like enzyme